MRENLNGHDTSGELASRALSQAAIIAAVNTTLTALKVEGAKNASVTFSASMATASRMSAM
ncbi:MAG: hypothetical protein ABR508_01445 [Candidatus Baltobacteraceae bacterium]